MHHIFRPARLHSALYKTPKLAYGKRFFSQVAEPLDLEFDQLIPPNGNKQDEPLVIMHGLFGSKRNWLSLSKAFLKDLNRPIYTLDLRNHGSSPHAVPMTYTHMADDVLHFFRRNSLSNVSLLGHSMGGKVAMAVALSPDLPTETLSHLIVADIAPTNGDLSDEFKIYIDAMKKIEEDKLPSRKEAQEILANYEKDPSVRAFLLTNFIPASGDSHSKFRVPLDILRDAVNDIGAFPYTPGELTWGGKTLFIKGAKSKYINHHNIPLAEKLFPNMILETLPTNHWVHAERPNEFKKLVTDFVSKAS